MSGASMWRGGSSIQNALDAVGDAMAVKNEIGRAEDSRLAQPDRIIWVDQPNTRKIRPCTAGTHYYAAGLEVFYEVSNVYEVHIRSMDVVGAESLERRLVNELIALGLWSPGLEVGDGSLDSNKNVAAEQGALIRWMIRLWTPLVYQTMGTAEITEIDVGVTMVDSAGNETGEVP